jgi:hypothetical protein
MLNHEVSDTALTRQPCPQLAVIDGQQINAAA